jgi:competence protein ComEC
MLLPFWSVALATGIALGLATAIRAWLLLAILLVLIGCLGAIRRRVVAGGGLMAVGLGVLLARHAAEPVRLPPPLAQVVQSGREVTVLARWVRVERFEGVPGDVGERWQADLVAVEGVAASGRLRVHLPPGRGGMLAGDLVRLRARLSEPAALANPGLMDPALAARAAGVDLIAVAVRSAPVVLEHPGSRLNPRRIAQRAHLALAAALDAGTSGPATGLLRALVLGERFAVDRQAEEGFKAAGALHVLSVSGLHVTAVAGFFFLLVRRLLLRVPGLALRVRPEMAAGVLCLPALIFYTLLTGEAVATARAAIMGGLAFGALVVRRPPAVASAIAGASGVLLLASPLLLLDLSFQLSFAGVAALAVLAGRWRADEEVGASGGPGRRAGRWLLRGAAASAGAFVVSAPLCAHHFAELAPLSPLGNLLLVPPLELGALPLGLAGSILGWVHPLAGLLPLRLAGWLATLALWLAGGFRRWAPVLPLPTPTLVEAALLVVGALLALSWARRRAGRRLLLGAALAVVVAGTLWGSRLLRARIDPDLRVTFLDVGQGDAALVEAPGGFVMLVDGGGAVSGTFDPGLRVVGPVLRRKGIGHIDLVVLSHPHPDHMNGLFHLLGSLPVGALWTAGEGGGNPEYDRLIALARARGVDLSEPRDFARGPLTVQVRGPWLGESVRAPPGLSVNDASLIVRVGFAGRWLFFSGDIEQQGEAELVAGAALDPVRSDVLKVPHHGSRTSSSEDLIEAVAPDYAVISLGRRNRFGFPRAEVLARYASRGIKLLRTDQHGAVTVRVRPDGELHVTCARSCR